MKRRPYRERVRIARLLRRFVATRNAARRMEERGDLIGSQYAWESNLAVWCELQELGIDPEDMREVA